jgi:hypothetical protein
MLRRECWLFVLIVILSALGESVSTKSEPVQAGTVPGPPLASKRVSSASRVTDAPSIDGALDEKVWQNAAPLTGFLQAEPFEGLPASENTEVRVLYDDDAMSMSVRSCTIAIHR